MAEQHSTIIEFPRGKYDPPKDEAEYLYRCPVCGEWVDCRNLGKCSTTRGRYRIQPTIGANEI
jgi:hypothetical protein